MLIVMIVLNRIGLVTHLTLDIVFLLYSGWALFNLLASGALSWFPACLFTTGVGFGLLVIRLSWPDLQYMPYLAIAPANLVLAHVFARGLLSGRKPVLVRLIQLMGQGRTDDPRFGRFLAGQCALWSAMAFSTAVLALGCMVFVDARPIFSTALTALIIIQIAWFALSHYYASLRFGRTETWMATLKIMIQPETWSSLRA